MDTEPVSASNELAAVIPEEARIVSGIWRRFAAIAIDSLIVGIVGSIIGFIFFDFFAAIGYWGRLFGFSVAGIYFVLLNSSLRNGQTFGKQILGIEVVTRDGNHISPGQSLLRYLILAVPFFINGVFIKISGIAAMLFATLIGFVIIDVLFIVYFAIFNRKTRQSIHDLITGTFVVNAKPKGPVQTQGIWKPHFIIIGSFCLILLGTAIATGTLFKSLFNKESNSFIDDLYVAKKIYNADYFVGKQIMWTTKKTTETSYLQVRAWYKIRPADYEAEAQEIASKLLEVNSPSIMQKDLLIIIIIYGYDIGIARGNLNKSFRYSPEEWKKRGKVSIGMHQGI
jgi:uncharacterized RDD family membrane protein YckC